MKDKMNVLIKTKLKQWDVKQRDPMLNSVTPSNGKYIRIDKWLKPPSVLFLFFFSFFKEKGQIQNEE